MSTVSQPGGRLGGRPIPAAKVRPAVTAASHPQTFLQRILSILLSILKWIAIAILAVLSLAFVLVTLFWGPTHWAISAMLAAGWLSLIVLLVIAVRGRWGQGVLGAALGFALLAEAAVALSQLSAYTPPIVDAQGKSVPGSIATLERVTLGGSEQWISIRGKSVDNPVLLWLSGGPGGSQLATERYHLGALEDYFVVVNWEQPGSGKSYHAVPHSALTVDRYVSDASKLVQYLRGRFSEDKVYVVGESWGSALGVWLVQRYPEVVHAFVGTGQMVDFVETEQYDYDFAMRLARERGDTKKVDELTRMGPPPYFGDGATWKQTAYVTDGLAYMNSNPAISDDGFDTFKDLLSPEYGLYDKVNWARGILDSGNVMFPQLWAADVDFRTQAPKLEVPVYFLIGRHDVNAPPAIAEEYYALLDAPHKEWVWFEHSGHNPWVHESAKFVDVVVKRVLAKTVAEPR